MNALWITVALLTAGFVGWPVTALVFRLARTIDDKADAAKAAEDRAGAADRSAEDPSADVTVDTGAVGQGTVDGEITVAGDQTADGTGKAPTAAGASPAPGTRILRGGAIIGSVFLVKVSKTVAKLRLLYVVPRARGSGTGRRLVQACIEGARARGYRKLFLQAVTQADCGVDFDFLRAASMTKRVSFGT